MKRNNGENCLRLDMETGDGGPEKDRTDVQEIHPVQVHLVIPHSARGW